jgi:hypothetical protein
MIRENGEWPGMRSSGPFRLQIRPRGVYLGLNLVGAALPAVLAAHERELGFLLLDPLGARGRPLGRPVSLSVGRSV